MLRKLALYIFILSSLRSFSQHYQKNFTEGNFLLLEKNYAGALESYKLAYMSDSSAGNANINYKMGLCYINIPSKKKNALKYLEKAVTNIKKNYDETDAHEKSAPPDAIYYYGKALHFSGMYAEAIAQFEKYKVIVAKNKERVADTERQIEMCKNAIEFSRNPGTITIKNLGDSVNTEYPDYSPVVNAAENILYFTSKKPGTTGGERGVDGSYYEDVYVSRKDSSGRWTYATNVIPGINTTSNEAVISLSPDGRKLFIYRDDNGGDIYYSDWVDGGWTPAVSIGPEVNSSAFESHLSISRDGNSMYFSSDRAGGLGGTDIYRVIKLPNGKWSEPYNLGPTINSAFNEDSPYLHQDGKRLFFSSEGHNSMGGLDIFYSTFVEDSTGNVTLSQPVNLRPPVNTPDDDEFYTPSENGIHAYFSSAREGGFGDQDIYIADLPKELKLNPLVVIRGNLTYELSRIRPAKTYFTVTDMENDQDIARGRPDSLSGKYFIILDPGPLAHKYKITYEAEGFPPSTQIINVQPDAAYQITEEEMVIPSVNMQNKVITIGGIIVNEDKEAITGAQIKVKDNNTGQLLNTYTTSEDVGFYYIVLDRGRNYNISFEAPGYLFQSQNIDIPNQTSYVELKKNITLEHIKKGAKMVMNNMFFDKNKATIRKQSTVELETLYKLMKENPAMKVEISGYTDNKGNDATNLKLSKARAQSVITYLTKKGIPAKRFTAKGLGKAQPIADNNTEEGRAQNRRVELKIVE